MHFNKGSFRVWILEQQLDKTLYLTLSTGVLTDIYNTHSSCL